MGVSREELLGPCGLNCGWCPFYLKGTPQFTCKGCWRREKCEIRDCAKSRNLKICTYCLKFPCEKLYKTYGEMGKFFNDIREAFPSGIKPDE